MIIDLIRRAFRRQNHNKDYVSRELFHFVGFRHPNDDEANYQILGKILDSGRIIHRNYDLNYPGRMTIDWDVDIVNGELVVPEVTCYCDIPFGSLGIHMAKYGRFGLGFSRSYLASKGARPVIYLPTQPRDYRSGWGSIHGVLAVEDWKKAWDAFYEYVVAPSQERMSMRTLNSRPKNAKESIMAVDGMITKDFFAFLKAFDCDLSEEVVENYYMEREWRLLGALSFTDNIKSIVLPRTFLKRFNRDYPRLLELVKPINH